MAGVIEEVIPPLMMGGFGDCGSDSNAMGWVLMKNDSMSSLSNLVEIIGGY